MKLNKATYFAFFFLFCFLASFSADMYRNIHTSESSKPHLKHSKSLSVSSKETTFSINNEFLFEETENETENDFQAQSFLLPFFISYFQYETLSPIVLFAKPLAENLSNPIYISICNFRI